MIGAARGLCDANCHLHGQGDSFHVATCAAEIARDAEREQLAAALREFWADAAGESMDDVDELADGILTAYVASLLPVVDRIANERAAAELRNVAAGICDGALLSELPPAARQALGIAAGVTRARADALDPS